MKAVIYTEFGPPEVLHVVDMPAPTPKDGEVLIRVHATPVAYGDLLARNFKAVTSREFNMPLPLLLPMRLAFGIRKPKVNILGSEFSGEVAAAGRQVTRFKVGDQVYGYLGQRMGAYAEVVCLPAEGTLALKPANMTHEQAAAVPYGAIMATSLLQRANVLPGQKVLINGASGGIGSAAVQLAKYYGAEVTGVCGAARMDTVKALGADHVIDYARPLQELAGAQRHLPAGQLQDESAHADAAHQDVGQPEGDLCICRRKGRASRVRRQAGRVGRLPNRRRPLLSPGAGRPSAPLRRVGVKNRGGRPPRRTQPTGLADRREKVANSSEELATFSRATSVEFAQFGQFVAESG